MIQVIFKNLEKSELAKNLVENRLTDAVERFPDLHESQITATLTMDNSPTQAGPDLFGVKVRIVGGKYDGVILERSANSLYTALSELSERLLERLNRRGDRERVKIRKSERKFLAN